MSPLPTRSAPQSRTTGAAPVLVTTTGTGSMDRYGRQLARHLPVAHLELDPGRATAGRFGRRPTATGDAALVRTLRRTPGLLHLAHHHLARYALALARPYVVTAHDLIRWRDLTGPGPVGIAPLHGLDRLGVRLDVRALRRAAHLVTPSEASRTDLLAELGLPPERVTVVPEGIDRALFRPVPPRPGAYVLFVGSEHPRKNLETALRAYALLRGRLPGLRFVKIGAPGDGEAPFREQTLAAVRALGLGRHVELVGEVPAGELPAWYSGALCLLLPSRSEGFGLPPLEAMACGCPSVVSTAGALPEVTGGAALTVAPDDAAGLAQAVERLAGDPALRQRLRERGLARAAEFTWARAARETMAVYDRLLAGPG